MRYLHQPREPITQQRYERQHQQTGPQDKGQKNKNEGRAGYGAGVSRTPIVALARMGRGLIQESLK